MVVRLQHIPIQSRAGELVSRRISAKSCRLRVSLYVQLAILVEATTAEPRWEPSFPQVNTSKGQLAKHEDLQKAFGTTDVAEIAKTILDKGELQVGGKEREAELDSLRKEISTGVAERCVDPTTQRPHTVTMIEKALNEIHFNVQPTKAVKSQVGLTSSGSD